MHDNILTKKSKKEQKQGTKQLENKKNLNKK